MQLHQLFIKRPIQILLVCISFCVFPTDFAAAQGAGAAQIGRDAQGRIDDARKNAAQKNSPQQPGRGGLSMEERMEMEMMESMGGDDMSPEMEEEMMMAMYGNSGPGGPGGPGGPRGRGRPGASSDLTEGAMLATFQNDIGTLFGTLDFSPLSLPADKLGLDAESGPALAQDAERAYKGGNYSLAMQLFFAHMVTEYDKARVPLQTVKYSKLLKRPVWHIRWGVSYTVRGDAAAVDPNPIREGKTAPGSRSRGRGRQMAGRNGSESMEMGMEMEMQEQMQEQMASEMEASMEEEMSMSMEDEMEMSFGGGGRQRAPASTGQTISMAPIRHMLDEATHTEMDKHLGLVATVIAEEFGKRYQQGDYGNGLCSVTAEEEASSRPRGPVDDLLDSSPEPLPLWVPGMVFLGEGDSRDIVKSAHGDNIELVLHFDVVLKTDRAGNVQNISRCRLLHAASGKSLVVSKGMDSVEAAQMISVGRESDERSYILNRVSSLFQVIDKQVKTIDMPKLSPTVAQRRVGTLLAAEGVERLRAMAEIRYYQTQNLLSPEDVEAVFQIAGGEEGLSILHGAQDAKLKVARDWAVSALGK